MKVTKKNRLWMKNNMCQFYQKRRLSSQFGRGTGGAWDWAKEGAKPKIDPGLNRCVVMPLGYTAWSSLSACRPSACLGPAVFQFVRVCREGRKGVRKEGRDKRRQGEKGRKGGRERESKEAREEGSEREGERKRGRISKWPCVTVGTE